MPAITFATSISNLLAAGAGLIASNPFNGHPVPMADLYDLSGASGYAFKINDAQGGAHGTLYSKDPMPVNLDKVSPDFINAVIATEDERFFKHDGLDLRGLASATADTVMGNMRGGSGIAQQMVKNALLGPDRTLGRKAVEAMLAVRIQSGNGRRAVLRDYFASAWMGRGQRGIALAPQVWFGTSWSKITLAQSATLAAMLKGPSYYDPYLHPERARKRRDLILDKLLSDGWASKEDVAIAKAEPIHAIAPPKGLDLPVQISAALRDEMAALPKDAPRAGDVTLTLDRRWKEIAVQALRARINKTDDARTVRHHDEDDLNHISASKRLSSEYWLPLPASSSYRTIALISESDTGWNILSPEGLEVGVTLKSDIKDWAPKPGDIVAASALENGEVTLHPGSAVQGAVNISDPRTGAILANVGAADIGLSAFDRTRAKRQPGSSVKPFLYLVALEDGLGPQSPIDDTVRTYMSNGTPWTPHNYENEHFGILPMHTALERSSNTAAAWIANRVGIDAMAKIAERAGAYAPGKMRLVLPSALGATETDLVSMTAGYGTLINDGIARKPHLITSIKPLEGDTFYTRSSTGAGPIASSHALDALVGMMRGVVTRGTAATAFKNSAVILAGKTGTSQDWRDAWFIGISPQISAGAWVGRDNSTPLPHHLSGGTAAAPIIAQIMKDAKKEGLIDDQGLRDQMMSSGAQWPPAIPENLPIQTATIAPASTAGSPNTSGSFWGIVDDQRGTQGKASAPDFTKSPPDRNGDIIDMAW